jgi:hypothetical protein
MRGTTARHASGGVVQLTWTCNQVGSIATPLLWSLAYGLGLFVVIALAVNRPSALLLLQSAQHRPVWGAIAWAVVAAAFVLQIILVWFVYCGRL